MNNQTQREALAIPKRRGRGWLRWLGGLAAVVVGLIVAGAIYESVSEAADIRAYPAPGQMVDVGGYRLHLNCRGADSPTVVIDAGWGDWSLKWSGVQEEVARTTQVCTYDRAGMGYSEAGPLPRTAEQFAQELHTLLQHAGIPGPYVLAGHSLGGLPVRVFVHDYPTEVRGVVLIDSMSPRQAKPSATAPASPTATSSSGSAILALPARIGLMRLFAGPLGFKSGVAPEVQPAYTAFSVTPRSAQAYLDEGTGLPESFIQAGAVKTFGDLPLIVLSARLNTLKDWQAMQVELLQLSTQSQQVMADHSGHNIETDQPEAAVGAIVKMVEQSSQAQVR